MDYNDSIQLSKAQDGSLHLNVANAIHITFKNEYEAIQYINAIKTQCAQRKERFYVKDTPDNHLAIVDNDTKKAIILKDESQVMAYLGAINTKLRKAMQDNSVDDCEHMRTDDGCRWCECNHWYCCNTCSDYTPRITSN